jgi:hypothetical protein
MIKAPRDIDSKRRLDHHLRPVDEQVVVIEYALALLGLDVTAKQRS